MKIGDTRVVEYIHPDSLNVTVWDVEQVKPALGEYAKEGEIYWARVTPGLEPFTVKQAAIDFKAELDDNTIHSDNA